MKKYSSIGRLLTLGLGFALPVAAGNWPGWRGPDGNGVSPDKDLPLRWSGKENVRWRVELPGPGNSSPIVWGDRVFVSQAIAAEHKRTLMCFDRNSGKLLWQSGVTYTADEPTQENNPHCAGTPATDGELVFVCFGSAGVFAYDFAGREVWHRDLGKLNHMFGTAVSTVLHGGLCYVNFGPGEQVRLVALKKATGEIAWEAAPPKLDPSEQSGGPGGPGGPGGGGRGGFGPGTFLAPQMLAQGAKSGQSQLSPAEFAALADAWFDKLDPQKSGKLSRSEFTASFASLLPPPPGADGPPGGGRGGGPGGMAAGGLFTAADTDQDGSLTRTEWQSTFARWARDWDTDKAGSLNEDKLRTGLNASLARPGAGGPGRGGRGGMGGGGGPNGSWSTPIVVKASDHEELVVGFPNRLAAYDPATGRQLWVSKGLGGSIYASPVAGPDVVVALSSGMGGGSAVALRPGGTGEIAESQRIWRLERVKGGMGSGVISGGYFYTISQDGIAACLDLQDGKTVWEERLKGSTSRGSSWSSLLLADGRIYIPNQAGDVFVLRAGPKFEVLATNSVGEPTNASLAAANHDLFFRSNRALWCFMDAKP